MIEFDHFFVFTNPGAPEVDEVLAFGLTEGTSNTHPGQGTANRRIFFHNAMLEFLWVCDKQEVHAPLIQPMQFWQRSQYRHIGFSPFGIGLRPTSQAGLFPSSLPFNTWSYCPPFLPNSLNFEVASNTRSIEPLIFIIPFSGTRPDTLPPNRRQPINHPTKLREITKLCITLPSVEPLSLAVQALDQSKFVTFSSGE